MKYSVILAIIKPTAKPATVAINGFVLPIIFADRKYEATTVIIEPTSVPEFSAFCGSLSPLTNRVPRILAIKPTDARAATNRTPLSS